MKATILALSLAITFGINTAAQRTPDSKTEPAHNVFVLTGCLEKGDSPTSFQLTRASAVGQTPPRSNATPAATESKGEEAYDLQATSSVSEQGLSREQLQTEVGARVEVTIRPVEALSGAPPLTTASPAGEKKPAELPRPRYTVVKISRLDGSCA